MVASWLGAPLYGALRSCGIGVSAAAADVPNLDGMWQHCERNNGELLASLREDAQHAGALQQIAQDDYALGRLTRPRPASEVNLAQVSHFALYLERALFPLLCRACVGK